MTNPSPHIEGAKLMELAARCEAASADEQADVIREAVKMVDHRPPVFWLTGEGDDWEQRRRGFNRMLDCGACESAAMILVPTQHEWAVNWCGNSVAQVSALPDGKPHMGHAATPALALCAAALKARALATQETERG